MYLSGSCKKQKHKIPAMFEGVKYVDRYSSWFGTHSAMTLVFL